MDTDQNRQMTEEEAHQAEQEFQEKNQPDPSRFGHHLRDQNVITSEENMREASQGIPFRVSENKHTGEIDLTISTGISPDLKKRLMESLQNNPQGFVEEAEKIRQGLLEKSGKREAPASPSSTIQSLSKEELMLKAVSMAGADGIMGERATETLPSKIATTSFGKAIIDASAVSLEDLAISISSALDCMNAIVVGKKLADITAIERAIVSYRTLHVFYLEVLKRLELAEKLDKQKKKMQ